MNPNKLHVTILTPTTANLLIIPRCYTLTHSDRTGDLFLTIAPDFYKKQLRGWQTRIMQDEVLAEWVNTEKKYSLHIYCQISGRIAGLKFRDRIFRQELPLVLECFRFGDQGLYQTHPFLDRTQIWVHFNSKKRKIQ